MTNENDTETAPATNGSASDDGNKIVHIRGRRPAKAAEPDHDRDEGDGEETEEPTTPRAEDTGKGPRVQANDALTALKVALRAAPRVSKWDRSKDKLTLPTYLVIAFDTINSRVCFSARDGKRWHETFAPLSASLDLPTIAVTLDCARELRFSLEHAEKVFPGGGNIRFQKSRARIYCGQDEPIFVRLVEPEVGPGEDDWKLPTFVPAKIVDDARGTYDATLVKDSTNWPGGGAIVARDEVDDSARRHLTLTDAHGDELLRAVIVPHGKTDGLPASRQMEFDGTLSPKNAKPAAEQKPNGKSEGKTNGKGGKKKGRK